MLIEKTNIKSLYSFINKKEIFKRIHRQFKFCLIVFIKGGHTDKFLAGFYLEDISILQGEIVKIAYDYDVKHIQTMSPNSLSFVECKNKSEFEIFKKLYRYPLLGSDEWDFDATAEFHMTNDSKLFHTKNVGYPLYEGKMINMFTHIFAKPRYWIDEKEGTDVLKKKELNRMKRINKNHNVLPQIDVQYYRLVWRDITNAIDRRTLISTIISPKIFLGNTLSYIRPTHFDGKKYIYSLSNAETLFLCGIFNSFPIAFILRHRVNLHVSIFHLLELPIPHYNKNNVIHKQIMTNTAKLICTTDEYSDLRKDVGVSEPVVKPEERLKLEAQINALSTRIYNLTKEEINFILKYFQVEDEKLKELTLNEFLLLK